MATAANGSIHRSTRHHRVMLGAMAALLITGCGSSKVAQCNDLAAVVNQTQTFMPDFENDIQAFSASAAQVRDIEDVKDAASQYTAAVDKVVTNLNTLVQNLQAISLRDETLTQFREDYIAVVQGFSTALEEASRAMNLVVTVASEDDLSATIEASQLQTSSAVDAIENLSQTEATLIDEVNAYCGAAPTNSTPDTMP